MNDAMIAIGKDPVLSRHQIGRTREYPEERTIGIPYAATGFYDRSRGLPFRASPRAGRPL